MAIPPQTANPRRTPSRIMKAPRRVDERPTPCSECEYRRRPSAFYPQRGLMSPDQSIRFRRPRRDWHPGGKIVPVLSAQDVELYAVNAHAVLRVALTEA